MNKKSVLDGVPIDDRSWNQAFSKGGDVVPHDVDGKHLKIGDKVLIPCEVVSVSAGEEYCNVMVTTEHPMYPADRKTSITLNTRQVKLVE